MHCIHYSKHESGMTHCALLPNILLAPHGTPNYPCDDCKRSWLNPYPETVSDSPYLQIFVGTDELQPSRGLGDTIAKFTAATGIDKVVEAIAGGDCGCKKRQEALNKLVPYKG